ncbi:hypothetical protein FOZ63_015368 [Perkinsus olseni]|uniref:Uncharacterized protein n=1 Tax=Perkinsus olseni TaxID=32597 RepID=A0A7J6P899_PEROL|nr:hypothetical protein FOZ62_023042 [Perkinsus olseni]KAF4699870.1 hypothetical protein FOZ63_015368 [Perkinsus olseni]
MAINFTTSILPLLSILTLVLSTPKVFVKRTYKADVCHIEYPHVEVKISRTNIPRSFMEPNFFEASTQVGKDKYTARYKDGAFDCHFKTWISDPNDLKYGGYPSEDYSGHILGEDYAAHYPFTADYDNIMKLLGTVTEDRCRKVAEFILEHPHAPYNNEGDIPWLRQYLLSMKGGWELRSRNF